MQERKSSGFSAGEPHTATKTNSSAIAQGWLTAVAESVSDIGGFEKRLARMAERLTASHAAERFDAEIPANIGRELARLGFSATALRRSVDYLAARLMPSSGPGAKLDPGVAAAAGNRISAALAALTEGYLDRETSVVDAVGTVFDTSVIGFALIDENGTVVRANSTLCAMTGRVAGDLRGSAVTDLVSPDEPGLGNLWSGGVIRTDARLAGEAGEPTAVVLEVTPLSPARRALVAVNVADTHSLADALIRQSLNNVVTGLPNRQQFDAWIERVCADPGTETVGVVHFDIDGFHVVNEALGHDAGNLVLRSVARRLREACDGVGRVAHTGGDEFTALVEVPASTLDLVRLVEEVDALLAEPVYLDGVGIGVTVSVGISVHDVAGVSPADLVRTAEVAARWSREDGRARWTLYDPVRDARERERFTVAATVAGAMEEGRIEVCYTPVVALPDRTVVAVEAVLHWNHPERGVLPSSVFADLSEITGSSLRLGRRILEDACAAGKSWLAEFGERAPAVAVRLGRRQCQEPELAASTRRVLGNAGLPLDHLQLLVTDDVLTAMDEDQREELGNLVDGGVTVIREQRGGGRFDALAESGVLLGGLKVDATVVGGLAEGAEPVVRSAAVGMLTWANRNLGMAVYAEGVRTAGQADNLAALGVVAGTGPHFGERLTAEEIRALLKTSA